MLPNTSAMWASSDHAVCICSSQLRFKAGIFFTAHPLPFKNRECIKLIYFLKEKKYLAENEFYFHCFNNFQLGFFFLNICFAAGLPIILIGL